MKIKHTEVSFQIGSPDDFINWNENNIGFGAIWPPLFFDLLKNKTRVLVPVLGAFSGGWPHSPRKLAWDRKCVTSECQVSWGGPLLWPLRLCGLEHTAMSLALNWRSTKLAQLTVLPCVFLKGSTFSVSSHRAVPVSRRYDKMPETINFKRDVRLMLPLGSRRFSQCVLDDPAFWPPA